VIRLAVFGSPVNHSRSPGIHHSFARQFGLDLNYRAIEADRETFPRLLEKFKAGGGSGCNVTVPLKHEAWKLAQQNSDSSSQAQAVNTLLLNEENEWIADNTDGRGLIQDLASNLNCQLPGARICIIGAGGAVAGILGDLLAQGPDGLVIANRTLERAEQLGERFENIEAISLTDLQLQSPFDLVINATSLGHDGKHPELPPSMFHSGSLCYDLNYGVAADPLRNYCTETNIRFQDGFGMLVAQAALSFKLWTGKIPDTGPLLTQLVQ